MIHGMGRVFVGELWPSDFDDDDDHNDDDDDDNDNDDDNDDDEHDNDAGDSRVFPLPSRVEITMRVWFVRGLPTTHVFLLVGLRFLPKWRDLLYFCFCVW